MNPIRLSTSPLTRFAVCMLGVVSSLAASDTKRLTFTQLASAPLVADTATWPAEIRALADHEVRLTGYLLPLTTAAGRTREFLLLRNQNACCFGRMPAPNEFVVVHAPAPGIAITMDTPVSVRGILRLAPTEIGGALEQLFRLDEAVKL